MPAYHQALLISMMMVWSWEASAQAPWELKKDKEGIRVYTRAEKGSAFKSFKALVLLEASTSEILEILKDADNYCSWYGYTKTSKPLKVEGGDQYNYVETIFPWPYKNRDMVYRMSVDTSDTEAIIISLTGLPDYLPEKKGVVRMKQADGYLLLHSKGKNTEVIYVFHSEPGDSIPSWLANNSIAELPFKTLRGLREVLRDR